MKAQFTITRWDDAVYDATEGEAQLGRVSADKTFTGPMEGTSTVELLTAGLVEGSAGYVASEKFRGTLEGRAGTFVMQHGATMSPDGPVFFGHVVPGTGTGDLVGLSGTVRMEHELITIEYTVG